MLYSSFTCFLNTLNINNRSVKLLCVEIKSLFIHNEVKSEMAYKEVEFTPIRSVSINLVLLSSFSLLVEDMPKQGFNCLVKCQFSLFY